MIPVTAQKQYTQEEIERLAAECIIKATDDGLLDLNNLMNVHAAEKMDRMQKATPTPGKFDAPRKGGFTLKWSMPQSVYHFLKMVRPDGVAQFDQNLDFMSWMKRRYPWFSGYELADKPWQDIAPGGSASQSAPLPKEKRDELAKKNAIILDEHGKPIKASTA